MKRNTISKLLLTLLLSTSLNTAFATGIPTFDIATFTQLMSEYETLKQQYSQLQKLESISSGSRGLGSIWNNPAVQSALPADWSNVLSYIKATPLYATERAKYPTSTNAKLNAMYDTQAANNATMSEYFNKSNQRLTQLQKLMNQIDSASDPAAKMDLQNRIAVEQANIQTTSQLVDILKQKQAQDQEYTSHQAQKEWQCKEFKKAGC
ncbi:type IV secretion system protein [Methylotenera sp.]|uniref:type IV secretion system protein n=1 Tax=Methylotenera sp. TaxID=2051956 RepID=UPI002489A718|nr:type IV secretion system protein [Methylotenera sp.]MDI1298624.1 type IV secretion system protein [Methylotenera sp.]